MHDTALVSGCVYLFVRLSVSLFLYFCLEFVSLGVCSDFVRVSTVTFVRLL